jgi:trigger factor
MQFSVATPSEFSRVVSVTVPAAEMEKEYKKVLKRLASTRKVDGFRQGKIPADLAVKYFGSQAVNESLQSVISKNYVNYLNENKPHVACTPTVEVKSTVEFGKDVEFDIVFDVFPEIKLKDFSELTFEKPVVTITDPDIDFVLEVVRKNYSRLEDAGEGSEVKEKDFVKVNFTSTAPDGTVFEKGSGKGVPVVAGESFYIPDFSDKLVGKKVGDKFEFDVTFPENFGDEQVAGKTFKFNVEIVEHFKIVLPEINSELFTKLGVPADTDMETFRGMIRKNLEHELNILRASYNTSRVFKTLKEANPINIPESAVRERCEVIREHIIKSNPSAAKDLSSDVAFERYSSRAKDEIVSSLIMSAIIKDNNLKVDDKAVNDKIIEFASTYEDKDQVANIWKKKENIYHDFRSSVENEMVVNFVLSKAQGNEVSMSFQDFRSMIEKNR